MANYLGLFQFGLLASFGFTALAALVSLLIYPLIRKRFLALAPALRSNILLIWLLAPALVGALFTLLSFMPSLLSIFATIPDHCDVHDGHLHLCLIHPPLAVNNVFSWGLISLLGVLGVIFIGTYTHRLMRANQFHKTLMMASYQHENLDVRVVEWKGPLAVSAGVFDTQVFISKQLLQKLTTAQLHAVIAHEQAHSHRKDVLRNMTGNILSFTHLPWLRRRLLVDLELACEQACDDAAAQTKGRLHVAETILAVERLFIIKQQANMLMSISGSNITARVEALLTQVTIQKPLPKVNMVLIAMGLLLALLLMMEDIHHFTESTIQLITG